MLESVKIARRQSEIRQRLAELAAKPQPTDDEIRQMDTLDGEYRANETRYRAALIGEDAERREAGAELETREGRQWGDLCAQYELRQAVLHLDEGRALSGATGEVVSELRSQGGFQGCPVPLGALIETRAGETVASGTPSPRDTAPIVDRLFAQTVAERIGVRFINVGQGEREIPITTGGAVVGWADGELADVADAAAFATTAREMKPLYNMGAQMVLSRRSMKQSGAQLEAAIRRDLASAIRTEMDRVIFQGSGSSGEPTGLLNDTSATSTAIDAAPSYAHILTEIVEFMKDAAITAPNEVRALFRPETFAKLETTINADLQTTEYLRTIFVLAGREVTGPFPSNITVSANALPAPTGDPAAVPAVLTTATGGQPPMFAAVWGGVDLIRDPYAGAASGSLKLTGIVTMDTAAGRYEQSRILTGLQT